MKSGPQQKGKAVAPTQGRTRNQPATSHFVQKGGGARYANTRTPVNPKFDTKKKHD
jgi:hypothetical protein